MKCLLIFSLFFIASCSSVARDWSNWERCGVAERKMKWEICQDELHGEKYHMRGFCYAADYCRQRTTMWPFRNVKKQRKVEVLFCEWPKDENDSERLECLYKNNIHKRWLVPKN